MVQEMKSDNWREIWRGQLACKRKTQMHLAEPLVLQAGQAQGILMHSTADRVCYSRKLQVAEDNILRLTPWFATASKISVVVYDVWLGCLGLVNACSGCPDSPPPPQASCAKLLGACCADLKCMRTCSTSQVPFGAH